MSQNPYQSPEPVLATDLPWWARAALFSVDCYLKFCLAPLFVLTMVGLACWFGPKTIWRELGETRERLLFLVSIPLSLFAFYSGWMAVTDFWAWL